MTDSSFRYGKPESDADAEVLARTYVQAFNSTMDDSLAWIAANRPDIRVLRQDREVVGGLLAIPMGQFFGGQRVSMAGIAGVAVAPHARGKGAATGFMRSILRELGRGSTALSALYPATFPLYRRVGYEIAGGRYEIKVRARDMGPGDRSLDVRPVADTDMRAVHALYQIQARTRQGFLDRGEYIWRRMRRTARRHEVFAELVLDQGVPEGYVFYWQEPCPGGYDVHVNDMAATTPLAIERLRALLADHGSQARDIIWHGGPDDPFMYRLGERGYEMKLAEPWMLRIVDVSQALTERGYPRDLEARLELRVIDDVIRKNHDRFVVDVAEGRAEVKRGGRGSLELHVRALASLYAGHMSAERLAMVGAVAGQAPVLRRASAVFMPAGTPSLADYF